MTPLKNSGSRKRGAQPGNLNALKHGFYSRRFTASEAEDLEARLCEGITDEVAMMRVVVRRLFDVSSDEDQDLEKLMATLNTLGMAAIRIGSLLRLEYLLGGKESDTASVISQALTDIAKELKLQV
jgi:hypothetical protein